MDRDPLAQRRLISSAIAPFGQSAEEPISGNREMTVEHLGGYRITDMPAIFVVKNE